VRPHEIRGIEIYEGAATVPPQYNDPLWRDRDLDEVNLPL